MDDLTFRQKKKKIRVTGTLILRVLLQENGLCAHRYARTFDWHDYILVTINWLPPFSSPLLKPSKSKLLSLVSPLLRGNYKSSFILRIIKKVMISHRLMRYLTHQQLFSCNFIVRSKRRKAGLRLWGLYPLWKYAHKPTNDWSIMLLNLYNSKKNTDSLSGTQSEWRPLVLSV